MSTYPATLDDLGATNPASSDAMNDGAGHASQHSEANDAIDAIQTTLGVDPQGSAADVAERLDDIEASIGGGGGDVDWPPDRVPGSPSAYDDEFTAFSGWSTLGTLDTSNVTDVAGIWHGARTTAGTEVNGIYKAAPSMPFTVTAKFPAARNVSDALYGLMLLDSTPTALWTVGYAYGSGYGNWNDLYRKVWTNRTTGGGGTADNNVSLQSLPKMLPYLRLVVTSSTSVAVDYSADGVFWYSGYSGINPGFTVSKVGICLQSNSGSKLTEVLCEWIRFT